MLYRIYGSGIPRWLNEGFAQDASKGARASFKRARGYNSKSMSSKVDRGKLFALNVLTTMDYPSGNQDLVAAFYDESERLVRFLVATDKEKFPEFLELSAAGQPFDVALFHASEQSSRRSPNSKRSFSPTRPKMGRPPHRISDKKREQGRETDEDFVRPSFVSRLGTPVAKEETCSRFALSRSLSVRFSAAFSGLARKTARATV